MPDILAMAGSTREASFNKKLLRIAIEGAEEAGAAVTSIDLAGFPMPLFDQDQESREGIPETARELKRILADHDGLLIASPEYNSSLTPLIKNTIDWTSRSEGPDDPALAVYKNKVSGIMSASPGGFGGLRGLVVLRMLLQNIGVMVLPTQVAVSGAKDAFNEDGGLKNAEQHKTVQTIGGSMATLIEKVYF